MSDLSQPSVVHSGVLRLLLFVVVALLPLTLIAMGLVNFTGPWEGGLFSNGPCEYKAMHPKGSDNGDPVPLTNFVDLRALAEALKSHPEYDVRSQYFDSTVGYQEVYRLDISRDFNDVRYNIEFAYDQPTETVSVDYSNYNLDSGKHGIGCNEPNRRLTEGAATVIRDLGLSEIQTSELVSLVRVTKIFPGSLF